MRNQIEEVANALGAEVLAHEATATELANVSTELATANTTIATNATEITNLKKLIGSKHTPDNRMGNGATGVASDVVDPKDVRSTINQVK